jgi:ferrous iron transport protein B
MTDMEREQTTTAENPCLGCQHHVGNLVKLGVNMDKFDYVVALAGNPNTGKSTVFNAITGLRQHTGNWPGKTVARAEGGFALGDRRFKLVDLPGTYSLLSTTVDEEIARNFILFARPDVTVVVVDASHLERNLNLALQVLEITNRAVVCLNLVDEARRHGRTIDHRRLARDLGVPVVPTVARSRTGIDELLDTVNKVATGEIVCRPRRLERRSPAAERVVSELAQSVESAFPGVSNARWLALRLLDGDVRLEEALRSGELFDSNGGAPAAEGTAADAATRGVLNAARALRWEIGPEFQDSLSEDLFTEAAHLADRSV